MNSPMRYHQIDIFRFVKVTQIAPGLLPDRLITGISYDSRTLRPGDVFVALRGGNADGHKYVRGAVEKGASAVVGMDLPPQDLEIPYYRVEDSRKALAEISAAFFNFPARKLTVIGVTGTDGKTTTSNLIFSILLSAGYSVGMISTVGAKVGSQDLDTGFHVTTPEAPEVQEYLSRMVSAGLTHVVLESTSHGLSQYRVGSCDFDIAVYTNITHEHLDYHGSFESYRDAKAQLLRFLEETKDKTRNVPRMAVLNREDQSYPFLNELSSVKKRTYGLTPEADLWAKQITQKADGIEFTFIGKDIQLPVKTSLKGEFNVYNCLAALAATIFGLGVDPKIAIRGIEAMAFVPGRMEEISMGQKFSCIVDFAHTPNALRVALQTGRSLTPGKVIVVFGAAGLRDRGKRRLMAEVAIEMADYSVFTAEDPRTEDLNDILEEMAEAARKSGGIFEKDFWKIPDRGEAIKFALTLAGKDDLVMACGKGHEQSMCFGQTEYSWDDRIAMRAALAEYLGIDGPKMPYLPTRM